MNTKVIENLELKIRKNFSHDTFVKIIGHEIYADLSPTDYHGMYVIAYHWFVQNRKQFPFNEIPLDNPPKPPKMFEESIGYDDLIQLEIELAKMHLTSHFMICEIIGGDPKQKWYELYKDK